MPYFIYLFSQNQALKETKSENMLATACALFATAISTAAFLILDCYEWPFEQISEDCYENYVTEPNCFCERPRGDGPGDVFVAQPVNTISNMAFVVVGLLIALACDKQFPRRYWHPQQNDNPLTRTKAYGTLLACVVCLQGPGSAALHASLTEVGRSIDQFCMYLIGVYALLYCATRRRRAFPFSVFLALYITLASILLTMTIFSTNTMLKRIVFTLLLVLSLVVELYNRARSQMVLSCIGSKERKESDVEDIRYAMAAFAAVAMGTGIWTLSKSQGPLCFPDSVFQGHAVWHVLTTTALGFIFLYFLSADKGTLSHDVEECSEDTDSDKEENV